MENRMHHRPLHLAVALLFGLLCAAPGYAQEDAQAKAQALATSANELARQGNFVEALELYEHAYALDPAPTLLFNIAVVQEHRRDWHATELAYERFLAATPDEEGAALARTRLDAIRAQRSVQIIVAGAPVGAKVSMDGEALPGTPPGPYRVEAGRHLLKVEAPGHMSLEQPVDLAAGETFTLKARLVSHRTAISPVVKTPGATSPGTSSANLTPRPEKKLQEDKKSSRTLTWILVGASAAALIAGGVTTALLLTRDSGPPSEDGVWTFPAASGGSL
jgi:hypothetical protein